jgi:hypothetical protein
LTKNGRGHHRHRPLRAIRTLGWRWELEPGPHRIVIDVREVESAVGFTVAGWRRCVGELRAEPGTLYRTDAEVEPSRNAHTIGVARSVGFIVDTRTKQRHRCQ